jgi:hypothetical protein
MEATDEFSNWEARQHIAHRNNYRFLFESVAMKPLVEFLGQTEMPLGSLQELNRETRCWNRRRFPDTTPRSLRMAP